jgi:hypothetical protein
VTLDCGMRASLCSIAGVSRVSAGVRGWIALGLRATLSPRVRWKLGFAV